MSLFETLKAHPDRAEACREAFAFLHEFHRDEQKRFRIVDPQTGIHLLNFTANGVNYRVVTPEEGVGLRRMQYLRVKLSMVGFDSTLGDQYAILNKITKHFDKGEYVRAAAGIVDMMNAISKANRMFPYAAEACAVFIVREGENMRELPTEAEIEAKISDWNEEGLHEQDFFFLCLQWGRAWNDALADFSLTLGLR